MKEYIKPTIELINLEIEDIILLSGIETVDGVYDNDNVVKIFD